MMRRKRDIALNAQSTVDLLDTSDCNLGIRKPSHSADYVPLVSPSSPNKFFQRISPTLRRTGNKSRNRHAKTSDIPLGIQPSPFINGSNLVSPRGSPSQKASPTASTVDSDDENPYCLSKGNLDDDTEVMDDHLFPTVSAFPHSNPEIDELSAQSSIASLAHSSAAEITLDRKGGVEFRMRNRDHIKSSSLHAQTRPLSRGQPDMVVTPTKDALQQTFYSTPPAKDDSQRDLATSPLESIRSFPLRSSAQDKSTDKIVSADGKQRRSSKSASIRIKEPRISLSGKKKFTSINVRETVKDAVTDEPLIKIFLLLLQPKAKIFELIQLFFPPSVTNIGDLIHLIPANATEKALGAQKYIGLVRPRRRSKEYTNMSVMASGSGSRESMGIKQGEILIAIPETFAARYMIGISKQILSNPRIRTLLEKSASSLSVSTSVGEKGMPMAVVKEEPETPTSTDVEHSLKRAQRFADESNASPSLCREDFLKREDSSLASDFYCRTPDDLYNFNGSYTDTLADISLQGSYSSWSRSFDSSVASVSRSTFVVEPAVSTPRRRKKQFSAAAKVAGAVFLYMLIRFSLDTSVTPKTSPNDILGVAGFLQFFVCFVSLVKMQRHKQRKAKKQPTRCPFLQHMKD